MGNIRGIRFRAVAGLNLSAALAALISVASPAVAQAQNPTSGPIRELVYAYGMAVPGSPADVTESFQHDGMIGDIHVKVGDLFKEGDKLLDFSAIGAVKNSEILAAPFDGMVTAIFVNKGERISAGAPLMTLSRLDHLILSVGVEPLAITKVKTGQRVQLASLSSDCKLSEGKVKRAGAAVDPKTRLVPVFIELPDGAAGCGKYFRAGIEVEPANP